MYIFARHEQPWGDRRVVRHNRAGPTEAWRRRRRWPSASLDGPPRRCGSLHGLEEDGGLSDARKDCSHAMGGASERDPSTWRRGRYVSWHTAPPPPRQRPQRQFAISPFPSPSRPLYQLSNLLLFDVEGVENPKGKGSQAHSLNTRLQHRPLLNTLRLLGPRTLTALRGFVAGLLLAANLNANDLRRPGHCRSEEHTS